MLPTLIHMALTLASLKKHLLHIYGMNKPINNIICTDLYDDYYDDY